MSKARRPKTKRGVCGRVLNARSTSDPRPYRHLPPDVLGTVAYRHEDGTTSWFGGGKWCQGSYEAGTPQ